MKLVKNIFVLGLVAFWAVMTSHCDLENIPGLSFLACEPEIESAAHQSSDCGDKDTCATVESGLYKSEEKPILVAKPAVLLATFALLELSDLDLRESSAGVRLAEVAPPGFARIWQFSFRTALPPRAPSALA